MIIRQATVEDLAGMGTIAQSFYASSRFLGKFDLGLFCGFWGQMIRSGVGVIFGLFDGEAIRGVLGALVYPEPYSGVPVASEMFWYVEDGHRGQGIRMYKQFEVWARERECTQVQMVHLMDSMPEKLGHVYERLGFVKSEVRYTKELT